MITNDHLRDFLKNLRSKINQVWARFCMTFFSDTLYVWMVYICIFLRNEKIKSLYLNHGFLFRSLNYIMELIWLWVQFKSFSNLSKVSCVIKRHENLLHVLIRSSMLLIPWVNKLSSNMVTPLGLWHICATQTLYSLFTKEG